MTEPNDDTEVAFTPPDQTPAGATGAEATPGAILPPPGPASDPSPAPASPTDAGTVVGTTAPGTVPAAGAPPLRADPNRPAASAWREPPWIPPRHESRGPSMATVVIGLIILAIGLYYLLDVTFGLDLPRITWGTLWPAILIIVGGLIVLRATSRR